MFRFKARIARNSKLLRRFATQKLDILGARYEFRIDQRFLKDYTNHYEEPHTGNESVP